jgi:hypothetical protein
MGVLDARTIGSSEVHGCKDDRVIRVHKGEVERDRACMQRSNQQQRGMQQCPTMTRRRAVPGQWGGVSFQYFDYEGERKVEYVVLVVGSGLEAHFFMCFCRLYLITVHLHTSNWLA